MELSYGGASAADPRNWNGNEKFNLKITLFYSNVLSRHKNYSIYKSIPEQLFKPLREKTIMKTRLFKYLENFTCKN